jgi:hypothetical protein
MNQQRFDKQKECATAVLRESLCQPGYLTRKVSVAAMGELLGLDHRKNTRALATFVLRILLGFAAVYSTAHATTRATYETCMEASRKNNSILPSRMDSYTTVIGTTCRREGRRIVFVYDNRLDLKKSDLPADFEKLQTADIKSMVCSNPALKPLIQFVDMRYDYYDANLIFVGTAIVRVEDCSFK